MGKKIDSFSNTAILPETIHQSLRERNPFASNAAPEPWKGTFPDVESINHQAFDGIMRLIKNKASNPITPLAGLVLGEAGEGKTHLLRRILLACKQLEPPVLFAFVRPLFDSNRPFCHLLKEIVLSLATKSEGEDSFSQLDLIVGGIIRDYVRHRVRRDPVPKPKIQEFLAEFETDPYLFFKRKKNLNPNAVDIIDREAVDYVCNQAPQADRTFLQVVFQYKDVEKQVSVKRWLMGTSIDEVECQTLGVSSCEGYSDDRMEQRARDMILTLGILFERYNISMVICFDQLDSITRPERIRGFGEMIHLLVDNANNMLPLAFVRDDSWNERFLNHLDKAATHRLVGGNVYSLQGCTIDQAKEIALLRMKQFFGEKPDDLVAIQEWLLSRLVPKLHGADSPRRVIQYANRIIEGTSEEESMVSASEVMIAEYRKTCDDVAADFDHWIPESEYLTTAAELFLNYQKSVLSCMPGSSRSLTWTGQMKPSETDANGKEIPYACFINKSKHWSSVSVALQQCRAFLKEHPKGLCTYVADFRNDFKETWTATNVLRKEVEKLGANIVILDQTAVVRWYGLASLSCKIGSGDINIGTRTATVEDLENFLRSDFSVFKAEGLFDRLIEKCAPIPSSPPPSISPEELIDAILDCLAQSALPLMEIERLVIKLNEKGIVVTQEWCLEQIGKNQHKLLLMPSRKSHSVLRAP